MVRVDLRTITLNMPPQEIITRDNVPASVTAVAYFRVIDPNKAIVEVENFLLATSQIAQTTLRSVLGKAELDQLLAERERLNEDLQTIIDEQTEPWGVKVTTVEIKDVEIPDQMQRAMARQAEAERERRAKIINAEGEYQAAAEARRRRRDHRTQPGGPAAALPADAARDRRRAEHDDRLPAADGHHQAIHRTWLEGAGGAPDGPPPSCSSATATDRPRQRGQSAALPGLAPRPLGRERGRGPPRARRVGGRGRAAAAPAGLLR